MTHVIALEAGQSSQGTSEPITPAIVLDAPNKLVIPFLAISDQYATFYIFFKNAPPPLRPLLQTDSCQYLLQI